MNLALSVVENLQSESLTSQERATLGPMGYLGRYSLEKNF